MNKKVKIFSTPSCPWCTVAKKYLEENEINFTDIDVSQNREEAIKMVQKSGHQGVPQLWIEDEVIIGFDKGKIDSLLDLS